VGGTREISIDTRVVAASNRDLRALVAGGSFRQDLFYRLNQLPLHIPPLRERTEDILPLARGFLERFNDERRRHMRFSPKTERALVQYHWPGNVRELKTSIELAALLHEGDGLLAPDEIVRDPMHAEQLASSDLARDQPDVPFRELSKIQKIAAVRAAVIKHGSLRKAAKELGISHQTVHTYLRDAAEG
jgi:transcriptional regulator with PAS, ATPase and Fis domain